jgi:hypothetical protein
MEWLGSWGIGSSPLLVHVRHEDRPFEISYNVALKCEVKAEESISLNVRGEIFAHNWSNPSGFQVQLGTCCRSFSFSLSIRGVFQRFLFKKNRPPSWSLELQRTISRTQLGSFVTSGRFSPPFIDPLFNDHIYSLSHVPITPKFPSGSSREIAGNCVET